MQQNQSPHHAFREGRLNFPFRTIRLQPPIGQIVTARTGIRAHKVRRLDARAAIARQTVMREHRRFRIMIANARKPYLATLAACRFSYFIHLLTQHKKYLTKSKLDKIKNGRIMWTWQVKPDSTAKPQGIVSVCKVRRHQGLPSRIPYGLPFSGSLFF